MTTVRTVSGRDSKDGKRGLPKLAHIELALPDGDIWVATVGSQEAEKRWATFACEIPSGGFEFCPICYERLADSREHVPPQNLGGAIVTSTCTRCNNMFGTRVERDLQDWFDQVYEMQVRVGQGPKPVSTGRVHVLQRSDGVPMSPNVAPGSTSA